MDKELTIVQSVLGKTAADYLKSKIIGGKSNQNGSDYEAQFAVFKLIQGLERFYSTSEDRSLVSQGNGFVDDFIVQAGSAGKTSYQLKNSKNVTWLGGRHPIAKDFYYQSILDKAQGVQSYLMILVLSDLEAVTRLKHQMPKCIDKFSDCEYFASKSLNISLLEKGELHSSLVKICAFSEIDKLTALHTIILGVWLQYKNQFKQVSEFDRVIREIQPNYLKNANWRKEDLDAELVVILDAITNFTYQVVSGILTYEYSNELGRMNGAFEYGLNTDKFAGFSNKVIKQKPSTFKELLELGLS